MPRQAHPHPRVAGRAADRRLRRRTPPDDVAKTPAKRGGTLTVPWSGDVDSIDPGIPTTPAATWSPTSRSARRWPMSPAAPPRAPTSPPTAPTVSRRRQDRHGQAARRRALLAAGQARGDLRRRQVRDRARLLQHRQQPVRARLLRRRRRREARREARARRSPASRRRTSARVVFKLRRPTGGTLAAALVLPLAAPVPREYALPLDREKVSGYGAKQVATGPYMVGSYEPGKNDHARPQPELERQDRLPPRLPRPDRDAAGQRRPDRSPRAACSTARTWSPATT